MTIYEFLAISGALAWLPQVIGFIHRLFLKPKFRITPSEVVQIGYTDFGPVVNLQCALSTLRTDALVEKITATISHEDGDSHEFIWKWLDETQSVFTPWDGGGGGTVSKNEPAIALKVTTTLIVQKTIHFQDNKFHDDSADTLEPLLRHINFLRDKNPDGYMNELLESKECHDLIGFFKNFMYWRAGKYELDLHVAIPTLRKPHLKRLSFLLTQPEVDNLRKNGDQMRVYLKNHPSIVDEVADQKLKQPKWEWANPKISPLD